MTATTSTARSTTTAPSPDFGITAQEREQARLHLDQCISGLKGAIKGLSVPQWTFSPGPGAWSIAQNTEHVLMVFEIAGGPMREKLAGAPPAPANYPAKTIDEMVLLRFPLRLQKFSAPPFVQPSGRFGTASEALALLGGIERNLHRYLDSASDLRGHAVEAPPLQAVSQGAYNLMDGYQWFLAAASHAARHTLQILEVRANESFPA